MVFNNYSRALARHYGIVAVAALVAYAFHANVDHRFSEMVAGLKEAAALKKQVQLEQLELFDQHRQATSLHNASRHHTQQAYELEQKAEELETRVDEQRLEAAELHKEADDLRKKGGADRKGGLQWEGRSVGDNLYGIGSRLKGEQLAKRAEQEAVEAQAHMDHAKQLEQDGTQRLTEAEAAFESANGQRNVVEPEHGLCKLIARVCDLVRRNSRLDRQQKASDSKAIAAATEMVTSLQEIRVAKEERDLAMTLYYNSSVDANASIAMLDEAKKMQEQVNFDRSQAKEYREKAKEEQIRAYSEEQEAARDDSLVNQEQKQITEYWNSSKQLIDTARDEERQAKTFEGRISEERTSIEESEEHVKSMIGEAKHYVKRACWYALIACVSGASLLALVSVRIVDTFRRQSPLRWIIRVESPFAIKDCSYLCNHILIFFLAMGFVGELLMEYDKHDLLGRSEIVILFAFVGSVFQAFFLHFIPNVLKLVFTASSLRAATLRTLLIENVAKTGLVLLLLFSVEMLLCWVNIGPEIFSQAYRFNGWWSWILVAATVIAHALYFMNHKTEEDLACRAMGQDDEPETRIESQVNGNSANEEDETTETSTLVSRSTISTITDDSTLLLTVDLNSPGRRSTTYGSVTTEEGDAQSISTQIASTFITSWRAELDKIRLLFEFLIASWALWIIRRDMILIMKLSPLSPDLVWGGFPLWILALLLLVVLGFTRYTFSTSRVENFERYWAISKSNKKLATGS